MPNTQLTHGSSGQFFLWTTEAAKQGAVVVILALTKRIYKLWLLLLPSQASHSFLYRLLLFCILSPGSLHSLVSSSPESPPGLCGAEKMDENWGSSDSVYRLWPHFSVVSVLPFLSYATPGTFQLWVARGSIGHIGLLFQNIPSVEFQLCPSLWLPENPTSSVFHLQKNCCNLWSAHVTTIFPPRDLMAFIFLSCFLFCFVLFFFVEFQEWDEKTQVANSPYLTEDLLSFIIFSLKYSWFTVLY